MAQIVKKANPATSNREAPNCDPFVELNRFFDSDPLSRMECPDIIAWYGVSCTFIVVPISLLTISQLKSTEKEFPVIRLMACDYMAIPASSCLAERSFSMSACTDDVRRRQMGSEKFGALQRLCAAYRDGRLEVLRHGRDVHPTWVKSLYRDTGFWS